MGGGGGSTEGSQDMVLHRNMEKPFITLLYPFYLRSECDFVVYVLDYQWSQVRSLLLL